MSLMRSAGGTAVVAVLLVSGCDGDVAQPSREDAGAPWFDECAADRGLSFTYVSGADAPPLFPEIIGGGAALFDADGDGDLDAYLVQAGRVLADPSDRPSNRLFLNNGKGTFVDATEASGADDRGYGMGVTTGDIDGDGDLDLYVTNLGRNTMLRNDGSGMFTDVTDHSGTGDTGWGTSAVFLDHDRDGDQDLFVVNYINWSPAIERECFTATGVRDYCTPSAYAAPAVDRLFRNEGDGTFTDVTHAAGIDGVFGNGLGVVVGDMDGDGWLDVYVANDATKNQMWLNQHDGTFRDAAPHMGTALDEEGRAKAGMGVCAEDLDGDGDLDLLVVNLEGESDSFYRNENGYFSDRTASVGLGAATRRHTRFGVGIHDLDHDGRLDIYQANGRVRQPGVAVVDDPYAEPNVLLTGRADGRFEPVLPPGGTAAPLVATSRAAAFGDVDGDGAINVLVVNRDAPAHLLRNRAAQGHWLLVRVLDEHGGPALGATVTATVGERAVRRDVRAAYSYCAASDVRIHFGLGAHAQITDVRVRWVDGREERFGDFDADRVITVRRGTGGRA